MSFFPLKKKSQLLPADPVNVDSEAKVVSQAGQVIFFTNEEASKLNIKFYVVIGVLPRFR